ncbi:hypothetical protein FWF93_00070 [Candidatus Saccharibacteria bacterium]|nr:hypothetical protein [Candidatus Saccharibacteria bacterium]
MFSGRRNKTAGKNKKSRVGFFKRTALLAAVFALVFNVTVGPLVANVSAASIEASMNAKAAQVEAANLAAGSDSIASTVIGSTTEQFGLFGLDEVIKTIGGFFKAVGNFLVGLVNIATCVAKFVAQAPSSLPIALLACPAIEMVGIMVAMTQGILGGILNTNFLFSGGSDYMKAMNEYITTIANVILAVIFLIIVAATAFGSGQGFGALSNYGIKKTLPKLLIMAIAINTSFYVCAALNDLSNIVGSSINSIATNSISSVGGVGGGTTGTVSGPFVDAVAASDMADVFSGTNSSAIMGALISKISKDKADQSFSDAGTDMVLEAALAGHLVVIVAIILVALVVIMIVQLIIAVVLAAVRNVMLVALIIVSPLAFVLGILPNTNKIFQKWLHHFGHMLMVYPAVMMLFAASQLTALVLAGTATNVMAVPMILAAMATPVFFVKKVITSTSSAMGAASQAVSGAVKTVGMVGASVATGGVGAAVAGKNILGGMVKGAVKAAPGGDKVLGIGETVKTGREANAKKRLHGHLAGGGSLETFKAQGKYEEEALTEAKAQKALSGGSGGGAGGGAGGIANVHVEHGTIGSVSMGGQGQDANSLEGLRSLLGGIQPGVSTDHNRAIAEVAAGTGMFNPADIEAMQNGSFTDNADDAIANGVASMDRGTYDNLSNNSKEIIKEVLTGDNSQARPKENNAAHANLEKIKVDINVNAKVAGGGSIPHNNNTNNNSKS